MNFLKLTPLHKGLLTLCALFQLFATTKAETQSSLKWNSDIGVYEVSIAQNEASNLQHLSICLQLPSSNLFLFDISSGWESRRIDARNGTFYVFNTSQFSVNQPSQKLFSFKLVGNCKKGELQLYDTKEIMVQNQRQTIQSLAYNGTNYVKIQPITTNKVPVVSYSNTRNTQIQRFAVNNDYLKEEIHLHSNWLEKDGFVSFFVYDINGKMVKNFAAQVSEGAQSFFFSYNNLSAGTYFIKARFGNWEAVLNDGFMKISDFEAVSN